MTQYALHMALPVNYTPEQFIVSGSNRLAYDWVLSPASWPNLALYLHGEKSSGKTHLSHLFARANDAGFLATDSKLLPSGPVVVEDVENWKDEAALFHLYNHCRLSKIPLLVTSQLLPDALPFTLPDLVSRLKGMSLAGIDAPDDELLQAVLIKQLSDRQLKIAPDVIEYLMPRLPRSFTELAALIEKLDSNSLESGRNLTIPYIRKICEW